MVSTDTSFKLTGCRIKMELGFTTYKAVNGLLERKPRKLVNNCKLSTTLLSEPLFPTQKSHGKKEKKKLVFLLP